MLPRVSSDERLRSFEGTRCVVTGGAGFIGRRLTRQLLALGVGHVCVIDSLVTSTLTTASQLSDDRLSFVKADLGVTPASQWAKSLKGVDFVFHLAAWKLHSSPDIPGLLRRNIEGTAALLQAAVDARARRVIFSSSLYANGRLSGPPLREDDLPAPMTVYGISKLTGEHLCAAASAERGLSTVCLRYFFVYGPGQFLGLGYPSVIVNNFNRLLRGESPIIRGDGQQRLDYIFVDDIVEGTLVAAVQGEVRGVINLGSGCAVSISELTSTMMDVAGVSREPIYTTPDWTYGTLREASIDLASAQLRLGPAVSLKQGLEETWKWIRHQTKTSA